MLKKEQILTILKKYGFYSLNRAPYLYQNKDDIGVYFIWPSLHYGNLERVLSFSDEKNLEDEVYKYRWFLNNKNTIDILVEFDNYEKLNPKVVYKYKNNILTSEDMKNFNSDLYVDESIIFHKKQLLRTADILILILKEKLKEQYNTYFKVLSLQKELYKLRNSYNKKLNQYNNSNQEINDAYELLTDDTDESEKIINSLYDELSPLDSVEEIQKFVTKVFALLQTTDTNEMNLQNLYLLERYPIEIEDTKKKINVLNDVLKFRKRLFKSKKNVYELLKEIDNNSTCKNMINVNLYIEEKKKAIQEKYVEVSKIEDNEIGDYLYSLENLDIKIPEKLKNQNMNLDKDKLYKQLKVKYDKLSKKEKAACHIATSFLGECLNYLMDIENVDTLGIDEIINKLILKKQIGRFNENFQLLDSYLNVKLRIKYFSILKIDSFENFIESLVESINILRKIDIVLDQGFIGYYNTNKEITFLNLKNFYYLDQTKSYIASVFPNVPLYFSPIQIVKPLDVLDNIELLVRDNEVIFFLKNKVNVETNSDSIKVAKYEKDKIVKKRDHIIITEMYKKNTCIYYENKISSLESEDSL